MSDTEPSLIERLLDEFVERIRRGETPSIAEYEAAHPECAEQIRELFPAVQAMEQIALRRQRERGLRAVPTGRPSGWAITASIREIGRGGMGIVYEAEQESLSRHVAVKVLPPSALLNARDRCSGSSAKPGPRPDCTTRISSPYSASARIKAFITSSCS